MFTNSNCSAVLNADGLHLSSNSRVAPAVTHCHNLRPFNLPSGESALRPVYSTATLASSAWVPLTRMTPAEGRPRLIVASGMSVGEIIIDDDGVSASSGGVSIIAVLDAAPLCAISEGSDLFVMTADGLVCLSLSDSGHWSDYSPDSWPVLSLLAVDAADCEFTVPPRTLSAAYSDASASLRTADLRAISSDLSRAYRAIVRQAASSASSCTPLLMRYRLISHDGSVLFVSPPLLLGASDVRRLSAPIEVTSTDRRSLDAYTVSLPSWKLRLFSSTPIPSAMAAAVGRIELLATPQLHPFDDSELADAVLLSRAPSDVMLRISLPGVNRALSPDNSAPSKAKLNAIIGAIDSLERVVAVIQNPFTVGRQLDMSVPLTDVVQSVDSQNKLIDAAMIARPKAADFSTLSISAPHRFSARCVDSVAGNMLWGDIEALRFDGFPIEAFAADCAGQGAWHAAVSVGFSSGEECVVALSSGSSGAPLRLNPVLSYPSPDAVSITFTINAAGVVKSATVPLTSDPSGRHAVFIHPSFAPFELSSLSSCTVLPAFVVPAVKHRPHPMHSCLIAARINSASAHWLSDVSLASLGDAAISDVFVASRSQSSWDFSNCRFSVFSTAGTFTATLSSTSRVQRLSVNRIDSRPVLPGASCRMGDRLFAIAGSDLAEVGVSRLRTLVSSLVGDTLAADPSDNELWVSSTKLALTHVCNPDTLVVHTRDELLTSRAVATFVNIGDKLCNIASKQTAPSTFIRWDGSLPLSASVCRSRSLSVCLDIVSSQFSFGSLSVRRASVAASEPSPSLRVSFDGRLAAPLRFLLRILPYRRLCFSLQGRVAPDTIFSSLSIKSSL